MAFVLAPSGKGVGFAGPTLTLGVGFRRDPREDSVRIARAASRSSALALPSMRR
jgi:hypothetical protein